MRILAPHSARGHVATFSKILATCKARLKFTKHRMSFPTFARPWPGEVWFEVVARGAVHGVEIGAAIPRLREGGFGRRQPARRKLLLTPSAAASPGIDYDAFERVVRNPLWASANPSKCTPNIW